MNIHKILMLFFGSLFSIVGVVCGDFQLWLSGIILIVGCLILCICEEIYESVRRRKINKMLKQMEEDWNRSLERLKEKLGSDDKDET